MTRKCSEITFSELTNPLNFVKIIYNGEIIYDELEGHEDVESLRKVENTYRNKIVYEMNIKIVDFHHCILKIKGE